MPNVHIFNNVVAMATESKNNARGKNDIRHTVYLYCILILHSYTACTAY